MDNLKFSTQHNTVAVAAVEQPPPLGFNNDYQNFILSPNTLILAACGVLLATLTFTSNNKNSQLAKGYWGSKNEINQAKKRVKNKLPIQSVIQYACISIQMKKLSNKETQDGKN